ncbi:hypothetical protein BTO13_10485 [Polaribacter gangjinensis]|uniref:Uncharacterized protein n=1 Tax=Polaribacter gangjinensis TaxID=574710 RepID=A0A2S7WDD2_9FLAO|nr:hypothetical protein BTO13_10485 [Polaribacter gangjinensis]
MCLIFSLLLFFRGVKITRDFLVQFKIYLVFTASELLFGLKSYYLFFCFYKKLKTNLNLQIGLISLFI